MASDGGVYSVEFIANPVQKGFIESRADADLFSSRFGEGKSAGLCWAIQHYALNNPGANIGMIRDTWDNLWRTTMQEFFEWFPDGVFGNYIASQKTYEWKLDGYGDGKIFFIPMDEPADAAKLQSLPLGMFVIDEPAPAAESGGVDEMIFDIAMGRLRQKGMNYYAAKLATNNPDETHWTYKRFVSPGTPGFMAWQPHLPENLQNLPEDYYGKLRRVWAHRPELVKRFVDGEYGYLQPGRAVTPQWNDTIHLATGLSALPRIQLILLWDFGHNPTCIITQITPAGNWNIIECITGDGIGTFELINDQVKPILATKYKGFTWRHIGDDSGRTRDQTTIMQSPVRYIKKELGGPWRSGPIKLAAGLDPLRAVLSKLVEGRGLIRVDRDKAPEVWHALRGGWHFPKGRTGVIGSTPVKNEHSHPGDAMRYGAARLFPLGRLLSKMARKRPGQMARYHQDQRRRIVVPPEARLIAPGKQLERPRG